MRRFWFWYLPLGASVMAVAVFGWGFAAYVRGATGEAVELVANAPAPAQRQETIAPIIVGDSLARGAGDPAGLGIGGRLDEELRRREIKARRTYNIAVNGARTPDLLELLERPNVRGMIAGSNVIIVSIGGNDLWGRADWRTERLPDADQVMAPTLENVAKIIDTIRSANPAARIFFIGLYNPFIDAPSGATLTPLVSRWNAHLIERFGDDPNFTMIQTSDLFSHRDRLALDRFHPGAEAYAMIARRIAEGM